MILNPGAKKVICFGDSLTWGHFHSGIRFPLKDRWTYKLQELLGDGYDVVEEGMRGRTTVLDDDAKPDRNGFLSSTVHPVKHTGRSPRSFSGDQ